MSRSRPKRACFVYYMPFNNSALLYRESRALQQQGFEVDIVDLRSARHEQIFQNFKGLAVYGIQARPSAEKNFRTYFARLLLFFVKTTVLLFLLELKRKYKLIHITAPPDFIVFTALVPKLLGAKIILDIHDISPELFMEKLHVQDDRKIIKMLKIVERLSCACADHVITVTDMWRTKLISRSVRPEKCSVLLNVPDEELFKALPQNGRHQANAFNLFYHGSLEEHFGVDTLLDAMPIVRTSLPNVQLYIYGGGRLKEQFLEKISHMQIDQFTHLYDKIPFYELPELLRHADVGVVPTFDSQFADDTISMKSLEYISLGIPIVISATKAHRFYFDDEMVKFFPPENSEALAEAIIALCEDKQSRQKLIRNSQGFLQHFGWQNHKQIYLDIVERLIGNGRA